MTGLELSDIIRDSLYLIIKMLAPSMLTVLIVGVVISIIQALTQIQESTLAFAPKIVAMFITLLLSAEYMGHSLTTFTHELFNKISEIK